MEPDTTIQHLTKVNQPLIDTGDTFTRLIVYLNLLIYLSNPCCEC